MRSTTPRVWASDRWAYRFTMARVLCPNTSAISARLAPDTVDVLAVLAWASDDGCHRLCLPLGEGDTVGDACAPELHQNCTMAQEGTHKALTTQELSEHALAKQYYLGV